jgi:RND family efflux transporter MFP subunit
MWKSYSFALMGLTCLAALTLTACNGKASGDAHAAEVQSAAVARVTRGTIVHTLDLAGQFQPYQVVDVHAKVSGYIKDIYVDIGDIVHEGQVLAILEVPELSAQLKGAVAAVAQSKDDVVRAEHEVTRAKSEHAALHADFSRLTKAAAAQPGLIAQQELDDAQAKDLASEAQVDAAESALAAAKQKAAVAIANNERVSALEAYTRVTSPLDGVVIWRYADTGALIQAGTSSDTQSLPVVKVSQSGLLRLRLPVPEDAVEYIHEGATVDVRVDAVGRTFVGKVVRFTRNVSLATRTMETEIDVENKDLSLTPGMYANTSIELQRRVNVLTIPEPAIIQDGNKTTVLVVDKDNRVQIRDVRIGLRGSNRVEVASGLEEGDLVITGGQSNYQAGEVVKPKLEQVAMNDGVASQTGSE